jgi:hypothetical protein
MVRAHSSKHVSCNQLYLGHLKPMSHSRMDSSVTARKIGGVFRTRCWLYDVKAMEWSRGEALLKVWQASRRILASILCRNQYCSNPIMQLHKYVNWSLKQVKCWHSKSQARHNQSSQGCVELVHPFFVKERMDYIASIPKTFSIH